MESKKYPLGKLKAEDENIKALYENFIKTSKYKECIHPYCTYISGRKGDGKTAIGIMLGSEKDKNKPFYEYNIMIVEHDFYKSLAQDVREISLVSMSEERYESLTPDRIDIESYFKDLWTYIIHVSAMKAVIDKNYLFNWHDVPSITTDRFKYILEHKFNIEWAKEAEIEKINDGNMISVTKGEENKKSLIFKINKEENTVKLTIEGISKNYEYTLKEEDKRLSVCEKKYDELEPIKNFLKKNNLLYVTHKEFMRQLKRIFTEDLKKTSEQMKDNPYFPKASILDQQISDRLNDVCFKNAEKNLYNHLTKNKYKCLISIDTLEKYFAQEKEFCTAAQGMMQAAKSIEEEKEKSEVLHIKCFIPDELHDELTAWNPVKAESSIVYLGWTYTELLHFVCKRYMTYLECNYPEDQIRLYKIQWNNTDKEDKRSLKSFWNKFFPDTVEDYLGGNEDCFNYILRHTQNTPRQVLDIMNNIVNIANEKGHHYTKINEADVREGVHMDMAILIRDAFVPFVGNTSEILTDCVKTMFVGQSNVLSGERIIECIERVVKENKKDIQLRSISTEYFKKMLLRSGLIGIISDKRTKKHVFDRKTNKYKIVEVYHTYFEYLTKGQHLIISKNKECECGLHSILADYCSKFGNLKTRNDICIYPYRGFKDGVKDDIFDPEEFNEENTRKT